MLAKLNNIINPHNRKIIMKFRNEEGFKIKNQIKKNKKRKLEKKTCSCKSGKLCPFDGKCLEGELIYKAKL